MINLIIFSCLNILFAVSMKVIPERANITWQDEQYVKNTKLYITRYGRNSPYYINLEGEVQQTWNNNVTLNLYFYEFLHNEYRQSFVEMHFKACDLINGEPYVGRMLANVGVKCPIVPKYYNLLNMSLPTHDFPHVWPFEKAKVEADITTKGKVMAKAYIYLLFKDEKKKIDKSSKSKTKERKGKEVK